MTTQGVGGVLHWSPLSSPLAQSEPDTNSLHPPFAFLTQLNNRILARGFSVKVERGVGVCRGLTTPNDIISREGGESPTSLPLPPPGPVGAVTH